MHCGQFVKVELVHVQVLELLQLVGELIGVKDRHSGQDGSLQCCAELVLGGNSSRLAIFPQ